MLSLRTHLIRAALIPVCLLAARPVAAQDAASLPSATAASAPTPSTHDSARVVALACSLVQSLRPLRDRHGCRLERLVHERDGYLIHLVEIAPSGARSPGDRSIVRFQEGADTVIVTRIAAP